MIIEDVLNQAASESAAFAAASGLTCRPGCGHCCTNPNLETTVAEMMPMSRHLWQTSRADTILSAIAVRPVLSMCVMYRYDPANQDKGSCGAYEFRPGICRLFGHCARISKQGRKELVTCRPIKEDHPGPVTRASKAVNEGMPVPQISSLSMNVLAVDPLLGMALRPINQALKEAIEREGMRRSMGENSRD